MINTPKQQRGFAQVQRAKPFCNLISAGTVLFLYANTISRMTCSSVRALMEFIACFQPS